MSVRSRRRLASMSSSAWRPWLNWKASIGSPPRMREIMMGRAVSPPPAMAPSIHLLPVAFQASASLETALASPPEVHQWVTSRSTAWAAVAVMAQIADAPSRLVVSFTLLSSLFGCPMASYNDLELRRIAGDAQAAFADAGREETKS